MLPLDARGSVPRWFPFLWDGVGLAIVAVAIGRLGLQPALLLLLATTLALVVSFRVVMWTFYDRKSNSVRLDNEAIRLTIGHPRFLRYSVTIPYSSIESVGATSECGDRSALPWPLRPMGRHVDIRLKRRRTLARGWRLGTFKVLHLGVDDPDELTSLVARWQSRAPA